MAHALGVAGIALAALHEPVGATLLAEYGDARASPALSVALDHFEVDTEADEVSPDAYLADVLIRVQTHPAPRIDELPPHPWASRLPAPP